MQDNILICSMKKLDLKEVKVMEVDEECTQAKFEEDVMYMQPKEGGVEVMKMNDSTVVSIGIDTEVMEESVMGLESQSEYLHHHGRLHTPLPGPATIIEKGVELG